MAYLKVNGVDLSPYIQTMTEGREPLWSSNTGRTMEGRMVGDIVARFWTIKCTTRPLTQTEIAKIYSALESADYFAVEFIPPTQSSDTLQTKTMYVSPTSIEVYSYNPRLPRYKSMSFELIEQ